MDAWRYLEQHGDSTELVIALHGYSRSYHRLAEVRSTITAVRSNADIFAPLLPYAQRLSFRKAETIAADLMHAIGAIVDARAAAGAGYQRLTFVGHSFGAVMARRLVVAAFGEQRAADGELPAPFEPELAAFRHGTNWAALIQRIVLLAGMNRGWTVSSALDWITTVIWSVLQFVGETVFAGKLTMFAIRRGAPFLAQTRLQWLALMDPEYGPRPNLICVQLLGSGDDLVSPDDNVDYAVDLFGAAGVTSFFYIEVPYSTHPSIIDMAPRGSAGSQDALERKIRRDKFTLALTGDAAALGTQAVSREQMADNLPPEPDLTVSDVVFVIHGIRDKGYWTQKIARTIKKAAEQERKDKHDNTIRFESWTESYGYFAMLPFILPSVRQRKVEWLMDCYVEATARYPRAAMHYVGHSNGTYLAAKALQDYPAARFKHIVFAGSVVRCNYDWRALMRPDPDFPNNPPRVESVLNYVATRDWVVALFPKALQRLRLANLGSAGHDGFDQASPDGPVYEVRYVIGSHGAGHEEPNWDDIARFVVSGRPPPERFPPFARRQSRFLRAIGSISFILFPLGVAIICLSGLLIGWSIFARLPDLACSTLPGLGRWSACTAPPHGNQQALRSFGFVIYWWLVYLFVTRF